MRSGTDEVQNESVETDRHGSPRTPSTNESMRRSDADAVGDPQREVAADVDTRTDISLVMPTMNEREGIEECIQNARSAFETLGVEGEIIVSDSSNDGTKEIAEDLGAIVVEPDKPGYGYAYRYAFRFARGQYIVIGDADTTYDFTELPKLFRQIETSGADMVIGSRFEGEIKPGAMPPLHRYLGNPFLTAFLNVFYDANVSDAHSGFRIIRREALDQLNLQADGMEFASEMIMAAGADSLHIEEVPIVYHERTGDATLESFRDGWRHVRFMLLNAPNYVFSLPGILIGTIGVLTLAFGFLSGPADATTGTISTVTGSILTILGYQIGSLGVFTTANNSSIQPPTNRLTTWVTDNLSLERGASAGLILFSVGGIYTTALAIGGVSNGPSTPGISHHLVLALTLVALGVQTIFQTFFLSTIDNVRGE